MQKRKSDGKYLVLISGYGKGKLVSIEKKYPDNIAHANAIVKNEIEKIMKDNDLEKTIVDDKKILLQSKFQDEIYKYEIVNRL